MSKLCGAMLQVTGNGAGGAHLHCRVEPYDIARALESTRRPASSDLTPLGAAGASVDLRRR